MMYNFSLGFKELGHEVTLVAAEDYKPVRKETYDLEVVFLKSNLKSIFHPSLLPLHMSLFSFLRKRNKEYDLIISSESFSFSSLFASLLAPKKLIIWQELCLHNKILFRLPSRLWYNVIVKLFYRKSLIVPRSELAHFFIKKYAKKVSPEIVEHGINPGNFDFVKEKKDQFSVLARLVKGKNVDIIINKFASFVRVPEFSHFKLQLIGDGDQREELERLVRELHLQENVIFNGYLSHKEVHPIISRSKAMLVYTSKDLNMVSIPESIMAGTPVVMNSLPGSAAYVRAENLGVVNDQWNEADLREIVAKNAVCVENCSVFRERLSIHYAANQILNIYEKMK